MWAESFYVASRPELWTGAENAERRLIAEEGLIPPRYLMAHLCIKRGGRSSWLKTTKKENPESRGFPFGEGMIGKFLIRGAVRTCPSLECPT